MYAYSFTFYGGGSIIGDTSKALLKGICADGISDLVNEASVDQWGALSTAEAAGLALRAAEALDAFIERLTEDRVAAALAAGFTRLVDRSLHRNEHLDDLDRPRP